MRLGLVIACLVSLPITACGGLGHGANRTDASGVVSKTWFTGDQPVGRIELDRNSSELHVRRRAGTSSWDGRVDFRLALGETAEPVCFTQYGANHVLVAGRRTSSKSWFLALVDLRRPPIPDPVVVYEGSRLIEPLDVACLPEEHGAVAVLDSSSSQLFLLRLDAGSLDRIAGADTVPELRVARFLRVRPIPRVPGDAGARGYEICASNVDDEDFGVPLPRNPTYVFLRDENGDGRIDSVSDTP